jgi:Na+/H+ antiporter NhaD/arsenite permease-like protein
MTPQIALTLIIITFIIGYSAIILEFYVKVNKTAIGIALAGICWFFYFIGGIDSLPTGLHHLSDHIADISQIIFFLLGAMTLVELIDSHKGFNTVISWVHTRSKKKLILVVSIITFFLSAVLDNLTTTILMISILRKLIPDNKERLGLNCMIVIAANAGGAWTPIGDVTTTMLWIDSRISTVAVMKEIFLPSVVSMLIPMGWFMLKSKGLHPVRTVDFAKEEKEPGASLVFALGILSLVSVPVIKWLTGLPPFMGMLFALALLWIVTDIMHFKYENRHHLRVPFILTKVDVASILFFLGILLSIDALESVGILKQLAVGLENTFGNYTAIAVAIGAISAIIDNVPLVAACMGMYDITAFPMDASFWLLVAFTAGTGGSMLSIGSAAGVALMGIEKVDFITYLKKASIPALLGYVGGVLLYIILIKINLFT